MSTIANEVRSVVGAVANALKYEPAVRADFRAADLPTVAAVATVLIGRGINTRERIEKYLADRGCRHDSAAIGYMLSSLEGRDRRNSLWTRSKTGRYALIDEHHF